MFLTKKHLSRRTLLQGAGVSLALPLLDAMIPAATALSQTAAARKLRVGFFYIPHGAIMNNTPFGVQGDQWMPSGSGANFKFNTITKSLEPYKKYVTSFDNIKNDAVAASGSHGLVPSGGGPPAASPPLPIHTTQPATWLSGVRPDLSASGPRMTETLDQVMARRLGQGIRLPSLQIASETTVQVRTGTSPYTVLSFRDATTPLPMEYNPRKIFTQLFGNNTAESRQKAREEASLLDLMESQTRALQRELAPADRAVLDSHLTAVREAEQRIEASNRTEQEFERAGGNKALPPMPAGVQDNFSDQVTLLFDLLAIAYRTDLTRIVSFIMAAEGTNQTYNHIGVPDSFHPVSHHGNNPDRIAKLVKIQTWHMERFAEFLGKLADVPDGEGTLLDNSLFLYGSNMSNSDSHTNHPLPTLLVGGAGGKLTGGRHIALPAPTPIANLHLSLLGLAGIEQKTFGDSTGAIAL